MCKSCKRLWTVSFPPHKALFYSRRPVMIFYKLLFYSQTQKILKENEHTRIGIYTYCCCLVMKSCPTLLWPCRLQPTRLLCPWDFPGKWGLSCGSDGKGSACNEEDLGSIPESRIFPGEGNDSSFWHSYWKIPWTGSLVSHSPWGCKELDMTKQSTGEGNGTPLQYSCLENPMDGGAW